VLDPRLTRTLPRLLLAAAALGLALWLGIKPLRSFLADGELARMAALGVLVAGGMLLYLALVVATGAIPRRELMRFFRRA
jgi:putative peptidoglycan lipid II flippase